MIAWAIGVNKTITNEISWGPTPGVLKETMRNGKEKVRMSSSSTPDEFNVVMIFKKAEYELFDVWFKQNLRRGSVSFQFPKIAGTGNAEYMMGEPRYSPYGPFSVKCSMTWRTA